jgi:hypothetical protein
MVTEPVQALVLGNVLPRQHSSMGDSLVGEGKPVDHRIQER